MLYHVIFILAYYPTDGIHMKGWERQCPNMGRYDFKCPIWRHPSSTCSKAVVVSPNLEPTAHILIYVSGLTHKPWTRVSISCSTTPLLSCNSAARLQSYLISYFCTSLVYYIIQNVLVNKKIEKWIFI